MPTPQKTHYAVDKFFLADCLSEYISSITFDEQWYVNTYPDVAMGMVRDRSMSAHKHFIQFGYFENRLPYNIEVDDIWYLENYDDVGQAVAAKKFATAQDHFFHIGYGEGRLPYAGFQLKTATNP